MSKQHIIQVARERSDGTPYWSKRETLDSNLLRGRLLELFSQHAEVYICTHHIDGNETLFEYLYIDIDSKQLEDSQKTAIKFADYFHKTVGEDGYQVFFSGSKGFHIFVAASAFIGTAPPTTERFGPKLQEAIARNLSRMLLETSDTQPDYRIYSRTRVLRAPNSIHFKTGLFKTPLSLHELSLPISEICGLARAPFREFRSPMNETWNSFTTTFSPTDTLAKLLLLSQDTITLPKKQTKPTKARGSPRTYIRSDDGESSQYSTDLALTQCRAIRNLTSRIISAGRATKNERLALATAICDSDHRSQRIHEILEHTHDYNRDITEANIAKLATFGTSCSKLQEDGICERACPRYRNKNGEPSTLPAYFGNKFSGAWETAILPDNIVTTYRRLLEYHKTTTDFFDWASAIQFEKHPALFSEAMSEQIHLCLVPSTTNYIIEVTKPDGRTRQLALVSFEAELISSLFVPLLIKRNQRFKEQHVASPHIYSYGYLAEDDSQSALIRPWVSEYQNYRQTLRRLRSDSEHKTVFSLDLKNFYPSLSARTVNSLIDEFSVDVRIAETLKTFISLPYRSMATGQKITQFIGLPQGPLISHVIAARHLLAIDAFISQSLSPAEATLVRYCDDFTFFVRDDAVAKKIALEIIPAIESHFSVTFHSEGTPGKSETLSIEAYRNKELENDLLKYQLKFEVELGKIDPDAKRDLLGLLSRLFGNSYQKIISVDVTANLKEIERQLSILRWKIPDLIRESSELVPELQKLQDVLAVFLKHQQLSHKLQTTLLAIHLALIEYAEALAPKFTESLITLCKERVNSPLTTNFLILINRLVSLSDNLNIERLAEQTLAALEQVANANNATKFLLTKLRAAIGIKRDKNPLTFDSDNWNSGSSSDPLSLSALMSSITHAIDDPLAVDRLFSNAGSEFRFYATYFTRWLEDSHAKLTDEVRAQYYHLAFKWRIEPAKLLLGIYLHAFRRNRYLTDSEEAELARSSRKVSDQIYRSQFGNKEEVSLEANVSGIPIFRVGDKHLAIQATPLASTRKFTRERYQSFLEVLHSLFPEQAFTIQIDTHTGEVCFIATLPPNSSGSIEPYLGVGNTFEDILNAEEAFIRTNTAKKIALETIILSAKNLGLVRTSGNKRLVLLSLKDVFLDTLKGVYTFSDSSTFRYPHAGRALPGIRIAEFYERHFGRRIESHEFNYGVVGYLLLLQIDPRVAQGRRYRRPKRILAVMSSMRDYIQRYSQSQSAEHLDRYLVTAYRILRTVLRGDASGMFRKPTSNRASRARLFFDQLALLTDITVNYGQKQCSTTLKARIQSRETLERIEKVAHLSTVNLVSAYSLLEALAPLTDKSVNPDYASAVPVIQLAAFYYLYLSALELGQRTKDNLPSVLEATTKLESAFAILCHVPGIRRQVRPT